MKSFAKTVVRALGFVGLGLAAGSAYAVAPRAYVSVNGSDLNTCNVPASPCRTYTGAISQVTPGGTVIVMDSGTFGGGTISQAVTINAPAGVVALAATPIIVDPGAGNAVVLRGLTFQAASPGTGIGITHQSGTLFVENVVVDGWETGIVSQSAGEGLFVKGSVFRNQASNGLQVQFPSAANVAVDDSRFERNSIGLLLDGGNGRVSSTVMSANSYGAYLENSGTEFLFQRCEVSGNLGAGFLAFSSILRVSQSTIHRNGYGLWNGGGAGALVVSFSNNLISGNSPNLNGTITLVALQ